MSKRKHEGPMRSEINKKSKIEKSKEKDGKNQSTASISSKDGENKKNL
jgi:hypothetical protein